MSKTKTIHEVEQDDQSCPRCWSSITSGPKTSYADDAGKEWFTCGKCGKNYPRAVGVIVDRNKKT